MFKLVNLTSFSADMHSRFTQRRSFSGIRGVVSAFTNQRVEERRWKPQRRFYLLLTGLAAKSSQNRKSWPAFPPKMDTKHLETKPLQSLVNIARAICQVNGSLFGWNATSHLRFKPSPIHRHHSKTTLTSIRRVHTTSARAHQELKRVSQTEALLWLLQLNISLRKCTLGLYRQVFFRLFFFLRVRWEPEAELHSIWIFPSMSKTKPRPAELTCFLKAKRAFTPPNTREISKLEDDSAFCCCRLHLPVKETTQHIWEPDTRQ